MKCPKKRRKSWEKRRIFKFINWVLLVKKEKRR